MAPRYWYTNSGGTAVEITDYIDHRKEYPTLTEKAEEGAVAMSSLIVNDPDMVLDLLGYRPFYVIEDDSEADDDVVFGGYFGAQKVSRGSGDTFEPLGRVWDMEVADANDIWKRRVVTSSGSKRPAETDVARVQWILGDFEAGVLDDDTTYVNTSSGTAMDAGTDYRGQYRDQVLNDCAQASNKNWWAQLHETGSGRETFAWYGTGAGTAYQSALWLSNDPTDWDDDELADGTSLFYPIGEDTVLTRDPQRVYSGVYMPWEGGAIYRTQPSTGTAYAFRDFVAAYGNNIKAKATATARATRLLADLDEQDDRITTSVRLPKGKATMLRAGMSVPFKAIHLPGYSAAYTWMRVLQCAVTPHAGGEAYDLALELERAYPSGSEAGTATPPSFRGSAFAGLLRFDGDGSGFGETGDAPAGGWYAEPTAGPLVPSVVGQEILVDGESLYVRVEAQFHFATVVDGGGVEVKAHLLLNGLAFSTTIVTSTGPPGLYFWTDYLSLDVHNLLVQDGDVIGYSLEAPDGGWLIGGWDNLAVNLTYLRVGRGTQLWNSDTVTWVGP